METLYKIKGRKAEQTLYFFPSFCKKERQTFTSKKCVFYLFKAFSYGAINRSRDCDLAVTAFAIQNNFLGKRPLFHKIRSFPCARQIPIIAFPYPSGGIYFLNLFSKSCRLSRFRKIFFPSFGKDALFSRRVIAFPIAGATLFVPSVRVLTPSKRESRRFRRRKGNFP